MNKKVSILICLFVLSVLTSCNSVEQLKIFKEDNQGVESITEQHSQAFEQYGFYFNSLQSEQQKEIYEQIYNSLINKETEINIENINADTFKFLYMSVSLDKESILNSRNLLVNIPRKEYNTAITDNQFNDFLRLITPYFITERKRIQLRINTEFLDEAGYINYIMTPGITLSELDKQRLKKIKSLLDEETLNTYKQLHKAKLLDITGVEEEMKNEEADYSEQFKKELEEGKHLEVKTNLLRQ